jgi:hypothetical protein
MLAQIFEDPSDEAVIKDPSYSMASAPCPMGGSSSWGGEGGQLHGAASENAHAFPLPTHVVDPAAGRPTLMRVARLALDDSSTRL